MQMMILQAQVPASSLPNSGKAAGGSENAAFALALLGQTMGGTGVSADGTAAAADGKLLLESTPSQLLVDWSGEGATSTGLIAAIDALLEHIGSMTETDDAGNQHSLEEAIAQLDQLLVWLGAHPQVTPVVPLEQEPDAAQAELEYAGRLPMLKSAVEGALSDLRSYLQLKGDAPSLEQTTLIAKQLQAVKQLAEGQPASARDAVKLPVAAETLVTHSVPAQQTASVHLERFGHQLLSAKMLALVPSREMKTAASAPPGQLDDALLTPEDKLSVAGMPATVPAGAAETAKPAAAPVPTVPVEQFAKTAEKLIVKQFQVTQLNGRSEARLSLSPAHLGHVQVRIAMHNGQLTAMFVADTAAAKEMLENQFAQLRAALQSQGLQVEKLEVTQNTFQSSLFQERGGQQGRDQQGARRSRPHDAADGEAIVFDAELTQSDLEQAVNQTLGFGRGISTKV
ncbi:flagellar hook-length control protein FliK [Paenibacillus sp. GCM10027626]|uniref:flagellar hook-length control protein FliK n=1 Tax=Paenibacillus sp. GCM10027626 TaxID=3273411 RepID=UPI00363D40E8